MMTRVFCRCLVLCLYTSVVAFYPNALVTNRAIHQVHLRSTLANAVVESRKHQEPLLLTSASDGVNEIREDDSGILPAAIAVGTVTAAMGFIYGQLLSTSVSTIWRSLPAALTRRGITLNPIHFITGICTLGGLLMGVLSSKLNANFTVADFVSAFSAAPAEAGQLLPRSRSALFPLLLLSLITSTFGFSVGPEAPMVCAGGLVGASLARKFYGEDDTKKAANLAYAGAAGALTAFMGIPIAGSIFALELTRSSAGLSSGAREAMSPAVAASVAALVLIRAFLIPDAAVGGHFSYGLVGSLSGRTMMLTALASSLIGAVLGTVFHKAVAFLKELLWQTGSDGNKNGLWKRQVAVKTAIGLAVGLLSSYYPQTLFWGEGSLQCVVDGQRTAFAATKHGLSSLLTSSALVNPSLPFSSAKAALQVGVAKLVAIILACAGKFPGGIIFPLFFAAAPFAHACAWAFPSSILPVLVICTMAATQASVTRTPLATALILSLSASATTELSVMLPACLVASYSGVYLSQLLSRNSYFKYSK